MKLDGWYIALEYGRSFVGLLHHGPDKSISLSPAYELQSGVSVQQDPRSGRVHISRPCMAVPLLGFPSLSETGVEISGASITFKVSDMPSAERQAVEKAIQLAEQLCKDMRAADAGIVIASADALRGAK